MDDRLSATPETGQEIQAADPDARRRAGVFVVVLGVLGGVAIWYTQQALAELEAIAEQDPRRAVDGIGELVQWLAVGIFVPMLGFVGYGYRLAYRVGVARRFPPPGMAVVRDTPVLSGAAATARARILVALMTVLLAASFALPVALMRVVATLEAVLE